MFTSSKKNLKKNTNLQKTKEQEILSAKMLSETNQEFS